MVTTMDMKGMEEEVEGVMKVAELLMEEEITAGEKGEDAEENIAEV